MMIRFVILAVPRTGSNLLCTLLNSHPEILCHHELFNPAGIFTALTQRQESCPFGSIEERDRDPLWFLERVWHSAAEYPCVGFKWTLGQNETVLQSVVHDRGVKKIVLRRRNRIKTYVSELIARHTQQWEVYSAEELEMPRPQVVVDPNELQAHINRSEQFYQQIAVTLDQSRQPHLGLEYESLGVETEQHRVLAFLGVCDVAQRLVAQSVKQNPTDLCELIANFDDLATRLQDSDLGTELYERET
jgi:LPS sulfotransferase NodH